MKIPATITRPTQKNSKSNFSFFTDVYILIERKSTHLILTPNAKMEDSPSFTKALTPSLKYGSKTCLATGSFWPTHLLTTSDL